MKLDKLIDNIDKKLLTELKLINNRKLLFEKEMLDISIQNVDKITNNNEKKIKEFLSKKYKVEEKFDGTKLTLWRNDKDWTSNYRENWIIAYKNQILYGEEFETVDREKTKKYSVGISQYAFIHDHMEKIHKQTKSFPKNTEIFIEFIQNKLTTTRDYKNKHGLYIIAYSPSKAEIEGGMIKTKPTGFFQDKIEQYAEMLNLNLPPVVFDGYLNSISNITKGIINDDLKRVWEKNKKDYEKNPYQTVKKTFLEFESTLGGKTEGVVLHSENGEIYKFVQDDQYDKNVRLSKKKKYQADEETERNYWKNITDLANKIIIEQDYDLDELSYNEILKKFSKIVYSMPDNELEKIFFDKIKAMKLL